MIDYDGQAGHATNAERAVLASILTDPDAIADVAELLPTPALFTAPANREVYEAMLGCWDHRIPPDFVNVDARLATIDTRAADVTTLSDLLAYTTAGDWSGSRVMYYAGQVKRASIIRLVSREWNGLLHNLAQNPELDPSEAVHAVLDRIDAEAPAMDGPDASSVLMPAMLEIIDEERQGIRDRNVTPTGIEPLDAKIGGGLKKKDLIILAARPSMGKTALAMQIAMHAATYGPTLFFSLEMDLDSITRRMLACASSVPFEAIERALLTPYQRDMLQTASNHLAQFPLLIDDAPALTMAQIVARCQRQKAKTGLELVVIDYLELFGDEHKSEEQRLAKISRRSKQLAKEIDAPVLLLSQLSREVERRNPPIPQLRDLRYSGAIEQDADKVLMLYREDYYAERGDLKLADRTPGSEGMADIRIAKQRNGGTGVVKLRYAPHIFRFDVPGGRPQFAEAQQTFAHVAD